MYEHLDVNFDDMAIGFMDIRKHVCTFSKMCKKANFVATPTSSSAGSEVTALAII